jgi:hypothetical protein
MSKKRARWRYGVALPMTLAVASCTAVPTPAPAPAPRPVAVAPAPAPLPVPAAAKAWDERGLDAGEWRYDAGSRTASFAQAGVASPLLTMACSGGSIELGAGLGAGDTLDVELKTSAGSDRLRLNGGRVALPSRDVRLDRIAFSRGRFALEASNGSTLTLPVQSEIGRLIEDCRG